MRHQSQEGRKPKLFEVKVYIFYIILLWQMIAVDNMDKFMYTLPIHNKVPSL
jgi:hypothetical protein